MSAGHGGNLGLDKTFKADDNLKTTTAQYMVVAMVPGTSSAVDYTVEGTYNSATVGDPTATARHAIGINQTYMTGGSTKCVVRMFGFSKATCGDSITAGEWIQAEHHVKAPTSTNYGRIFAIDDGQTSSSGGYITATAHTVVLGRALENGSTNTVIEVFVNPQMYEASLMPTST